MPEIGKLTVAIGADTAAFQTEMGKVQQTMGQVGASVAAPSSKFAGLGSTIFKAVGVAGGALAGLGAIAVKMAGDFEAPMRNVNTMLKLNDEEFSKLNHQVLELSKTVPASAETLAKGLYQVVSAGVPAADAMSVLETAARAGSAGLATTEEAASALVAVIKGMGMSFDQTGEVADKLFRTVELGVTTFPELSATIGRVIPLANAAGISLDEVLGATAALTGITGNTAEVMTQLRAVMQALIKPTADMEMAYVRVGAALVDQGKLVGPAAAKFTAAQAAAAAAVKSGVKDLKPYSKAIREAAAALGPAILQSEGFGGTLKLLGDYTEGDTAKLGKMFGSVEALTAVMSLSGTQAADFAEKTAAMATATDGAGAAAAAAAEQAKGFNYQMNMMLNGLKATAMGFVVDYLPALSQVALLLPIITGGVGMFTGALTFLGPTLLSIATMLGPIGLIVIGITAVLALLALAWSQNWGDIQGKTEAVIKFLMPLLEGLQSLITAIGDALGRLGEAIGGVLGRISEVASASGGIGAEGFAAGGIGAEGFAAGGIVTRPTLALLGEAGPEAVVPLSRATGSPVGMTVNLGSITVNDLDWTEAKRVILDEIEAQLNEASRRSGLASYNYGALRLG